MWHVYNRGNDKRSIFKDDDDYRVFLSYLKYCLSEEVDDETRAFVESNMKTERPRRLNLFNEVELISYCLMPNHFHLQLYQKSSDGISKLTKSVMTGYVAYFNSKYKKSGRLFQGVYKAVQIGSDNLSIHVSRYIHLNPIDLPHQFDEYDYSSYKYYSGAHTTPDWLKNEKVISNFKNVKDYSVFCAEYIERHFELKEALKESLADA
jgi:putative transposase